ncbi:MAG: hypothetical protein AAF556_12825, partial [Pseudomonadota bacterium]
MSRANRPTRKHVLLALAAALIGAVATIAFWLILEAPNLSASVRHAQWEITKRNACGDVVSRRLDGLVTALQLPQGLRSGVIIAYQNGREISFTAKEQDLPMTGAMGGALLLPHADADCVDGSCARELAIFPADLSPWLSGFTVSIASDQVDRQLVGDIPGPLPRLSGQPASFASLDAVLDGDQLAMTA